MSIKPVLLLAAEQNVYKPDPMLSFDALPSKTDYEKYKHEVMGLS